MASPLARRLRTTPTDAEIRLWSRLRRKQLGGFRFRRQHPMGPYVVDFFCPDAKLIIEIDGGQHAESASDAARTHWLEVHGYRVIRFWNNEVLGNTEGVLLVILDALRADNPADRFAVAPEGSVAKRPNGLSPTLPSPSRGEGLYICACRGAFAG